MIRSFYKSGRSLVFFCGWLALGLEFTACNSTGQSATLGQNVNAIHSDPPGTPDNPTSNTRVGDSCVTSDPNHICLGLKVVAYQDSAGVATLSQAVAISDVQAINSVWNQCNLGFQINQFEQADPVHYGLSYQPANLSELNPIRSALDETNTLLVVITGPWNRTGTLGSTGANAWTNMPGYGPFGAVLEKSVANYPNIIGHELGHYLNLDHVSDTSNLMNPIIYTSSMQLSSGQCATARSAAASYWTAMKQF